ncbi:MAG TPA: redoxin domain-containing protein [Rubricoccaceae bacterium]|jgi:peroxiredoxin
MLPLLRPAALLALLAVAACTPSAPPVGGPAPAVEVQTASGVLRLADLHGQQVVLQFAPADSLEAWAALAAASADLTASGALVIGVSTDGTPPESPFRVARDEDGTAAAAFGYTGVPLAVVIDRAGVLRGLTAPRQPDDLFALAAPVLLEEDAAEVPGPPVDPVGTDAESVERLVRGGAALIDLRDAATREAEGPVRYALVCPVGRFAADVLPADVGTAVVLLGPDASEAARQAAKWGYRDVHAVTDVTDLAEAPADAPVRSERPEPRRAVVHG